jgi:hypothetical protein
MSEPQFESLDQMADATAGALVQAAAGSAFQLFRDTEFRRLAGFEQLSQVEQDRIFRTGNVSSPCATRNMQGTGMTSARPQCILSHWRKA